jgi:hypothetical protein
MGIVSKLNELLAAEVQRRMQYGFTEKCADGSEFVSIQKVCPHDGCSWTLDVEWKQGADIVRWLGTENIERLAQEHLENHLDPWLQSAE